MQDHKLMMNYCTECNTYLVVSSALTNGTEVVKFVRRSTLFQVATNK